MRKLSSLRAMLNGGAQLPPNVNVGQASEFRQAEPTPTTDDYPESVLLHLRAAAALPSYDSGPYETAQAELSGAMPAAGDQPGQDSLRQDTPRPARIVKQPYLSASPLREACRVGGVDYRPEDYLVILRDGSMRHVRREAFLIHYDANADPQEVATLLQRRREAVLRLRQLRELLTPSMEDGGGI